MLPFWLVSLHIELSTDSAAEKCFKFCSGYYRSGIWKREMGVARLCLAVPRALAMGKTLLPPPHTPSYQ